MKEDHNESGDFKSLVLLAAILLLKGYDKTEIGYRGCGYDLLANKNGTTTIFNIKQRSFESTKFGDIVISSPDFNALIWAGNNIKADKLRYVYIFTDCLFISDENNWGEKTICAPKTQRFYDHTVVEKHCKWKSIYDKSLIRIDWPRIDFNKLLRL